MSVPTTITNQHSGVVTFSDLIKNDKMYGAYWRRCLKVSFYSPHFNRHDTIRKNSEVFIKVFHFETKIKHRIWCKLNVLFLPEYVRYNQNIIHKDKR